MAAASSRVENTWMTNPSLLGGVTLAVGEGGGGGGDALRGGGGGLEGGGGLGGGGELRGGGGGELRGGGGDELRGGGGELRGGELPTSSANVVPGRGSVTISVKSPSSRCSDPNLNSSSWSRSLIPASTDATCSVATGSGTDPLRPNQTPLTKAVKTQDNSTTKETST